MIPSPEQRSGVDMNIDDYIDDYINRARDLYECDEIDIDSGTEVSLAEGGAQGWFWVPAMMSADADSKEEHDDSAEG